MNELKKKKKRAQYSWPSVSIDGEHLPRFLTRVQNQRSADKRALQTHQFYHLSSLWAVEKLTKAVMLSSEK